MKVIKPIYGEHYGPGYTGFSRPNDGSFLSKGIIWFQERDEPCDFVASHVFLVVDKEKGIESAEKGVEYLDLQQRINDPSLDIVFRKPEGLDEIAIAQMFEKAREYEKAEKPYDYTGLFGWVLRSTLKMDRIIKPLRKLPVPLNFFGGLFCSAFVSACLRSTDKYRDWPLFREWHVTRISPAMLWNSGPWTALRTDETEKGGK